MLRLYSRYTSSIITKQQNFNLWNHDFTPLDAQSSMLFYYRSFYRVYRAKLGEIRTVTVQHVSCLRTKHILDHFKYCARWGARQVLSGGHGGQALLSQTHGQCPAETTFRGRRSEQAIHAKPAGLWLNSSVQAQHHISPQKRRCAVASTRKSLRANDRLRPTFCTQPVSVSAQWKQLYLLDRTHHYVYTWRHSRVVSVRTHTTAWGVSTQRLPETWRLFSVVQRVFLRDKPIP